MPEARALADALSGGRLDRRCVLQHLRSRRSKGLVGRHPADGLRTSTTTATPTTTATATSLGNGLPRMGRSGTDRSARRTAARVATRPDERFSWNGRSHWLRVASRAASPIKVSSRLVARRHRRATGFDSFHSSNQCPSCDGPYTRTRPRSASPPHASAPTMTGKIVGNVADAARAWIATAPPR